MRQVQAAQHLGVTHGNRALLVLRLIQSSDTAWTAIV